MKDRKLFAVMSALTALALAAVACGGGDAPATTPPTKESAKATETKEAPPTEEPEDEPTAKPTEDGGTDTEEGVAISELSTYVDSYGYYHVAGAIQNNTEDAVENVELELTLVDGEGETLLTDTDDEPTDSEKFPPHLYTLGPGDTSTFDYTFYPEDEDAKPEDWQATVEVADFDETNSDRAQVRVENQKLVVDESGNFYLTGEIVNEEDAGVSVNGVAGAILDADDNVLGADYGYSFAYYLYPASDEGIGSRTPYLVRVDGPIEAAETSIIYFDIEVEDDDPSDVSVELQETDKNNYYIDDYGRIHLVTAVTNTGEEAISVRLVAGLYAENGETLDAASYITPIYVQPGETVPVSFDYFDTIYYNEDAADAVASYKIKIDPDTFWTYETSFESINMPEAEAITDAAADEGSGGSWTFTGNFTNIHDADLSSAIVMVVLTDKATGNIVATSYDSVYPEGDAIAAGDSLPFEIYLQLDPEVDAGEAYAYSFIVQGYPKD